MLHQVEDEAGVQSIECLELNFPPVSLPPFVQIVRTTEALMEMRSDRNDGVEPRRKQRREPIRGMKYLWYSSEYTYSELSHL